MKYFLIAGEASGDLHGSRLIKALKERDTGADFRFWGGDGMAAEFPKGLLMHFRDHSIMGIVEVITHLRRIMRNFDACKKQITEFQPDVVIFIDYPGFNLRMAKFCKEAGFRTAYFIAPKVWAWKENRALILERYIDVLLLILPFELAYFKKWKVNARYVGNPLVDIVNAFKPEPEYRSKHKLKDRPVLALLPGSRKQEIKRVLPVMLDAAKNFPGYQTLIAGAPSIDPSFYAQFIKERGCKIVFGETYNVLAHAEAAIVRSEEHTSELQSRFGISYA